MVMRITCAHVVMFSVVITIASGCGISDTADNVLNKGQRQATERREQQERDSRYANESLAINNCKQGIRGAIRNASTLTFADHFMGARAGQTEGGWSATLSGSTADGPFEITCYMDQSFRVTMLR